MISGTNECKIKNFHTVVIVTTECTTVLISNAFTRTTNFELNVSVKTSCNVFPLTHAASGQGHRSTSQVIFLAQLSSPAISSVTTSLLSKSGDNEAGGL
jgi:hypothetical protein